MIFKSIKWWLQIWYGLILVAVLVGFGVTAYQLESGRQMRRIDGELMSRAEALAGWLHQPQPDGPPGNHRFRPPPPADADQPPFSEPQFNPPPRYDSPDRAFPSAPVNFRLPLQVENLFDESDPHGFYFVCWWHDGKEFARSTNAPALLPRPERRYSPKPQPPRVRSNLREVVLFTLPGEIVLVGRSVAPELAELWLVAFQFALIGGGILLLGIAGGWWFVGRALRPIYEISATAAKISAGDLSQRINTADTQTELGELAAVLNTTFARLETTFAQQKQFTSDAAHELRTPVSVILTQTQSTLSKERTAAEYRETLEACQRAAQRMRRLIAALLELARFDAGQDSLKREPVDLVRLASEGVELVRPLAEDRSITIKTDLASVSALGNGDQLALVIANLLTNAVQHNDAGSEICIATRAENGMAILSVTDNGAGVAEEHLPHLFERFYRTDAARSSHTGGAGLGLAIVKSCVEACGGTAMCRNLSQKGFEVEVLLPQSLEMVPAEGVEPTHQ